MSDSKQLVTCLRLGRAHAGKHEQRGNCYAPRPLDSPAPQATPSVSELAKGLGYADLSEDAKDVNLVHNSLECGALPSPAETGAAEPNRDVEYWISRAKTAELKVQTFAAELESLRATTFGNEVTVAEAERLIRKMEACTSTGAKLILLQHFASRVSQAERGRADRAEAELATTKIHWNGALKGEDDALRKCRELRAEVERLRKELADYKRTIAYIEPRIDKMLAVLKGGQREGS